MERLVTAVDISRRYSITAPAARKWLREGLIKGHVHGSRWYGQWDAIFGFEGRLTTPQGSAREAAKRPLLTVLDLAHHFSASTGTIRRWLRAGTIPGLQIQGTWYVDQIDIESLPGLESRMRLKQMQWHTKQQAKQAGTEIQ
jgi:hypothetical protein